MSKWLKLYDEEIKRVTQSPLFLTASEYETAYMLRKANKYLIYHTNYLNRQRRKNKP